MRGRSPLQLAQDLSLEQVLDRVGIGDSSLDKITAEVGYRSGVPLRNLLRLRLGRGVRELRGLARKRLWVEVPILPILPPGAPA